MPLDDQRHVVLDGTRALHMRRIANTDRAAGRPVVLLHESPRSSAALMPLGTRLADRFTVFALDTPGYGSSDPLAMHRPEIADFADAIARSLRALGLTRVPVYGTHTGATIAIEMARRHPDLVAGVVLDGYPVFTVEERDLHHAFYMKDFPPRWDGGHIVELWSRICDQFDFFPWYLRTESARLAQPKADLTRHRAVLRDFLLSGEHYGTAYAASFRFDGQEALRGHVVPIRIVARPTDLLFHQMQRLGELPPGCTISEVSAEPDAWASVITGLFDAMAGDGAPPVPLPSTQFGPTGLLGVVGGRMLVRFYGMGGEGKPLLLLHDTPGSAAELHDLALRLARHRNVLVPERPNHGRSLDTQPGCEVEESLAMLTNALALRADTTWHVAGVGAGGDVARLLATMAPDRIASVVTITHGNALAEAAAALPPRMDGADLVALWFECRGRVLTRPDGTRRQTPIGDDIDAIQRRFVAGVIAGGIDTRTATAVAARLSEAKDAAKAIVTLEAAPRDGLATEGPYAIELADTIGRSLALAD